MTGLTYPEVGATRREPMPNGYHHLHYRTQIGTGADVFDRAGEAIATFRMHRAIGLTVRATADRAAPGMRLTVGLGPFTVPCEIVYVVEEPNRAGFGYGTLPGHMERGEEAFVVERDPQDRVWFRVTAFSRPVRWPTMLGGPLTDLAQRGYAWLCGRALTRLAVPSRTVQPVGDTSVTWWGHSTMWLADSGTTLLTDPLLTDRLLHLRRMAGPPPELPGPPDAVLLSHLHADHFHLPSLRALPGEPLLVVPRGAAAFVAKGMGGRWADRCVELEPGEETTVGAVTVRAVRAAHPGSRGPWSRTQAVALGFVVEGTGRTWYAGDTGLFDEMTDLAPLDLALIPVGGWGPTLHAHQHLDADAAAEALRLVKASWAVPVHYGTFWPMGLSRVRPHMFAGPGAEFARQARRTAPNSCVRVLAQGETLTIGPTP